MEHSEVTKIIIGLPEVGDSKEGTKRITKNAIRCKRCEALLESKFRHDYKICHCANPVGVDGGLDYLRRIGDPANYEDLSVVERDVNHSKRRASRWMEGQYE